MRRILIALTVASSLSVPSSYRLFQPFWNLLSSLWTDAPVAKAGCGMDPSGLCAPASASPQTQSDIGCGMDPDGRCASASTSPQTQSDIGCGADPDGRSKCL
jgi:hypothetical protein